jgi:hypothetical protein
MSKSYNSISVYNQLLTQEDITVKFNSYASTASFNVATRTLVMPTYGDKLSVDGMLGLSLHESGHGTDTDEGVIELAKKYGKSLINILEDVRIEKIQKKRYANASAMFLKSYKHLILDHNFFETAGQKNPYDFSHMNFLDRINCYYKVDSLGSPTWSKEEQVIIDMIGQMETVEDMENVAKIIHEKVKEQADQANDPHGDQDEQDNDDDLSADQLPGSDDSESDEDSDSDEGSESDEDSDSDEGPESSPMKTPTLMKVPSPMKTPTLMKVPSPMKTPTLMKVPSPMKTPTLMKVLSPMKQAA